MKQFSRNDVELIDQQESYQGFFQIRTLHLRHRLFEGGWSESISRELFMRNDAVGVLLYDADLDAVALVEQFRIGVLGSDQAARTGKSPWLLELVAGLIDTDENPQQIAHRESMEEAGVVVQALEPIGQYYSSPGGSNEYFYLFAGRADLSAAGGVHGVEQEHEDIRVHVLGIRQLKEMLAQGELSNAHTLIAVQWLLLNHQRMQSQWASKD